MATSGSSNFKENMNGIILAALQLIGVYGVGRTVSSEDMTYCELALNRMIKSFATQGLHLWCKSEGVLYLTQYTGKYSLGNAATDALATLKDDEIITQLNGALAALSTAITVDSTSGMVAGDHIGVVLTDKSINWTTISSVTNSTQLVLTAGVSGAASDNAMVFTFTNRMYKPLRILSARFVNGIDLGATSTESDIIMNSIAYQDYFEMPTRTNNGIPNQFHYNPKLTNGTIYIWPRPTDCSARIEFTFERIIEDLDEATNDYDFPSEWGEPLVYQLALRIAPAFGRDKKLPSITPVAVELLDYLKSWDNEITSIYLMPDNEGV